MARKQSAGYKTVTVMLHVLTIILVIVVIAWLGTLAYQFSYKVFADEAYSETGGGNVTSTIRIEDGTSAKDLAEMLENAGLIENKWVFFFQLNFSGQKNNLQAGSYRLTSDMTSEEMITEFTQVTEEEEEEDATETTDSLSEESEDSTETTDDASDTSSVTAGSADLLDSSLSSESDSDTETEAEQ